MIHDLVRFWFELLEAWGYLGVFFLMALESSIVPVPSEIVMPPAAYWASQGRLSFWWVVMWGTIGSYVGSTLSYFVAQWVGLPFIRRYGKYVLLSPENVLAAEAWIRRYGTVGIFLARLLPVIRHLISMPAGILKMNFWRFSAATLFGAGLWCFVLAWVGRRIIGDQPELLSSPDMLVSVIRSRFQWFILCMLLLGALYAVFVWFKRKNSFLAR